MKFSSTLLYIGSGVGRIVYRAVGLYQRFAGEEVLVFVILAHGDVEVAVDALVLLKLQDGPLAVVDKLLQGLLQVVEHGIVRARNLSMVDGNLWLAAPVLRGHNYSTSQLVNDIASHFSLWLLFIFFLSVFRNDSNLVVIGAESGARVACGVEHDEVGILLLALLLGVRLLVIGL